jgi:cell division protein FtsA
MITEYENDLVFGLDIGTRTVIGIVGYAKENTFTVLENVCIEHEERAMLDGQIHDILKVAHVVQKVKTNLENKMGKRLTHVALAAAGRVLSTKVVEVDYHFEEVKVVNSKAIAHLQMLGIQKAKQQLIEEKDIEEEDAFCVGHTVIHYYLDDYLISNLEGHKGKKIAAKVLATFLPKGVIDSLYAVADRAGLEVMHLTLEPIAALEAIIPENLRLLNLALVDIGAGTSDIAITKEGSVTAYGMIPVAGDEVTEAIVHKYLVDFNTAERIKHDVNESEMVSFQDILGFEYTMSSEEVKECMAFTLSQLAGEIGKKILELNGDKPTNAVFCVGGGSQMNGLPQKLAKALELSEQRVGMRDSSQVPNIIYKCDFKAGPEMITPLGICLVTALKKKEQFTTVSLNGKRIELLNAKKLTVMDALLAEKIDQDQIFPKRGKTLMFKLNNERIRVKGTSGFPCDLLVNGLEATMDTPIVNEDKITLTPAILGEEGNAFIKDYIELKDIKKVYLEDESRMLPIIKVNGEMTTLDYKIKDQDEVEILSPTTLEDFLKSVGSTYQEGAVMVNLAPAQLDYILQDGDCILVGNSHAKEQQALHGSVNETLETTQNTVEPIIEDMPQEPAQKRTIIIQVNGEEMALPKKESPYMFANIFDYIQFDLSRPQGNIVLTLNGERASVTDLLQENDILEIYWQK